MSQERYRQIKKKALILKNRKPFHSETAAYIAEKNQIDWISSCLRLAGTPISPDGVKKIVQGELLVDVSLKNHQLIHRYTSAMRHMQSMLEMGTNLTEKSLLQLYEILFEPATEAQQKNQDRCLYRTEDPIVEEWEYRPPHFSRVGELMGSLFLWLSREEGTVNPDRNPILRAVLLHHQLLAIYPFGERSPVMARAAMLYELMTAGFPPIRFSIGEQEYNSAVVLYLKKRDCAPFYDAVEKSVLEQLEIMVQLTAIR